MRRISSIVGAFAFVFGITSVASASSGHGSVMIVHGLPGFTADIYVNGDLLLDGFEPTSTAGPLRLDPGSYDVEIREVGAAADSPPVLSGSVDVSAGSDISIVAHLTRSGDPTLSVFQNRFERLPAGGSLLRVRDVAQAPPLSVLLDGRRVEEGLRQGKEWGMDATPGPHVIAFDSTTKNESLIPSTDIHLAEGVAQIVYVVGSARGNSLDLMLQSIHGLGSAPSGVLTGSGGLGAEPGFPAWAVAIMVIAGTTLVFSARQLLKERAQAR